MQFFLEVLIGGLLSGVMYSLVALGFVLIFKASGVFNFAQGALVFLAALTTVGLMERGAPGWITGLIAVILLALAFFAVKPRKGAVAARPDWRKAAVLGGIAVASLFIIGKPLPFWVAVAVTLVFMVGVGVATERIVLRPLVNQPPITLFMATIGLTFFLEGLAQAMWGANVRGLDIGIPDEPIPWLMERYDIQVSSFDLAGAGIAAVLVAALALFFNKTRIGRALRAVADDHQAALAVGIPLKQIWAIVWAAAGFVALVAGLLWGARNGVQFALTFVALKALPVLILGGFESIAGAIVGGLIIGASEKLAEVYIGPMVGGGIESWFAYVVALLFLLVRPEGLFGEKHIDRV
jgi:branched-chain amino acid transport system permease protein